MFRAGEAKVLSCLITSHMPYQGSIMAAAGLSPLVIPLVIPPTPMCLQVVTRTFKNKPVLDWHLSRLENLRMGDWAIYR